MKQFVHERQRNPHDCVLCSLAMFLGRPYEDVLGRALGLCERTRISWSADEPMPASLMRMVPLMEWRKAVATIQELPESVPAILTLESSNPAWLHCVYIDRSGIVFDPMHGISPEPFDASRHLFAEATVAIKELAPMVMRETLENRIMAWPELEVKSEREHRKIAAG